MTGGSSSLLKALHAVQASAPTLKKDKTGQYQNKYVPLDSIVETMGPLLKEHGLVFTCGPTGTHDEPTLSYSLIHAETNERIEGKMPLMIGENPTSQALGSAITYARRYALTAVLNLVADEDDDGAAAQSYGRAAQAPAKPQARVDTGEAATEPQKKRIKGDLRRAGDLDKNRLAQEALYLQVFDEPMPGMGVDIWDVVTKRQAGRIIDRIAQGSLPTGASDVPSDTSEFEQPTLEGGDQDDHIFTDAEGNDR